MIFQPLHHSHVKISNFPCASRSNRKSLRSYWLAILLFVSPFAAAQDATRLDVDMLAQIDARMREFVEQNEVSGVVTVVGTSRGIASLSVVGQRNLEKQQPMQRDTVFRIASMTKPITALGIMILAEQGRLAIDDPLEKYLPELDRKSTRLNSSH